MAIKACKGIQKAPHQRMIHPLRYSLRPRHFHACLCAPIGDMRATPMEAPVLLRLCAIAGLMSVCSAPAVRPVASPQEDMPCVSTFQIPLVSAFETEIDQVIAEESVPSAQASMFVRVEDALGAIENEDQSPSIFSGTDRGAVAIGASQLFVLKIENRGIAPLKLTGKPEIGFRGPQSGEFTLVEPPASAEIAPGEHLRLLVEFSPRGSGERQSTVIISSDDPERSVFFFALKGFGAVNG